MLSKFFALLLLISLSPVILFLYFLVKLTSKGPFIFNQLRAGKDKKPFYIYKIRTMVENAESLKKKYLQLNEADEPVFKIRNDPRYTKVGKILSHTGLDELPQLINIIKGEMAFVGPRPFPINEAEKIHGKFNKRFSVLPGVISLWIIKGGHRLSFEEWMKIDLDYIKKKSQLYDFLIFIKIIFFFISFYLNKKVRSFKSHF